MQYLGNAAWYGVGVNRWPIEKHPSYMLYQLARSPLTQRDWKVKDRFGLVRLANSCYCALHFPIVPCHGRHHEKVGRGGTVKKFFSGALCRNLCLPHFWNASGLALLGACKVYMDRRIDELLQWTPKNKYHEVNRLPKTLRDRDRGGEWKHTNHPNRRWQYTQQKKKRKSKRTFYTPEKISAGKKWPICISWADR